MNKKRILRIAGFIMLLLATFLSSEICAQSVYQLSVENVLPTNYVRTIQQDKYGYLWFATTSGLARYDGYQTEVLKPSTAGNRKFMQDSRILGIKLWGDRFLWVRLRGRLYSCYDIEKNAFVDFTGNGSYSQPIKGYTFLSASEMMVWN